MIPVSVPTRCFLADRLPREPGAFRAILRTATPEWLTFWMTMADRFMPDKRAMAVRVLDERLQARPEEAALFADGLQAGGLALAFCRAQRAGTLAPVTLAALATVRTPRGRQVIDRMLGAPTTGGHPAAAPTVDRAPTLSVRATTSATMGG